jgi:hypothetical protein
MNSTEQPMPETPEATTNPGILSRLLRGGCLAMVLLVLAAMIIPAAIAPRDFDDRRKRSCPNNLKQLGLVFKMYANESGPAEYFPALSTDPGRMMFEAYDTKADGAGEPLYPVYISDPLTMYCPEDPHRVASAAELQVAPETAFDDHSYFYLGYAVTDEESMVAFAAAYRAALGKPDPFLDDLSVAPGTGTFGTGTLYRLRDSLAHELHKQGVVISGTQPEPEIYIHERLASRIPVIIERIDLPGYASCDGCENHSPLGGNVLFLDYSVRFIPYPGEWPMTEATMRSLLELNALGAEGADS